MKKATSPRCPEGYIFHRNLTDVKEFICDFYLLEYAKRPKIIELLADRGYSYLDPVSVTKWLVDFLGHEVIRFPDLKKKHMRGQMIPALKFLGWVE